MKTIVNQKKQSTVQKVTTPDKAVSIWFYIGGLFLLWILFHYKIIFGIAQMWEDMVNFEFPNRIFARDCLLGFSFPHWDPNTFSGMPFFASSHTAVFYPTNILLSFLNSSKAVFWYFLQIAILLHFFLAGVCMFFYALHAKLSRPAAFVASVGYMFCGFLVTHSIHPMMLYIFTWLPVVLLLLEKGFSRPRKALTYSLSAGLILGVSTLAGHPQITFFEILFLGAYGIYLLLNTPGNKIKQIGNLSACFGVTAGIACILYLPAAELSENSVRTQWTYDQVSEGSFQIAQFITFIMPKVFGAWTGDNNAIPPFWLKGPHFGYYTYWETCFYAGIGILLLAILQFKRVKKDRFIMFCAVWMIISLFIAIGNNTFIFKLLYEFVPGFDKFRIPARILFTWNFLLPLLAARSIDMLRDTNALKKHSRLFIISAVTMAIISLSVAMGIFRSIFPELVNNVNVHSFATNQGWFAFFNIILLSIIMYLRLQEKLTFKTTALLLALCITTDLLIFGMNHHQTRTNVIQSVYGMNPELSAAIKKDLSQTLFRVNSRQFAFNDTSSNMVQNPMRIVERNQGMIDKIQLLEGYNPYNLFRRLPPTRGIGQFQRLLDLLNVKYYLDPSARELAPSTIRLNTSMLPRAKMFYNYELFENDSSVKTYMLTNNFDYKKILLLTSKPQLELPQTEDSIHNSVTITRYENNRIELEISTEENGFLWLSEIWYPAWNAYVNGKQTRILCADYSFRAIEILKGTHKVTLSCQSRAFQIGALIALVSIVLSCSVIVLQNKRDRKPGR